MTVINTQVRVIIARRIRMPQSDPRCQAPGVFSFWGTPTVEYVALLVGRGRR